ncbi:hypothetical protein MYX84_02605 [Acidobacteria bacterium AH-259-O06]|nr:hypothetical protein [Acidobacteria bacterium AH-259-O06]
MQIQTMVEANPDGHEVEYTYFDPDPDLLEELLRDLFENHWDQFFFGPCIQGSVFELQASVASGPKPHIGLHDGRLWGLALSPVHWTSQGNAEESNAS